MKFKLLEHSDTNKITELTDKQAIKLMNTTYSEATNVQPIYRGIDVDPDLGSHMLLLNPDLKNPRPSANTYNYYTLFINNNPVWKDFPKRQIICTTDSDISESYGNNFIVYPKNGAKIGICPGGDIWNESYDAYNEMLDQLFRHRIMPEKMPREKEYRLFLKACEMVDENKRIIGADGVFRRSIYHTEFLDKYFSSNISLIDFIGQEIFTPKNFEWVDISNFGAAGEHEVWTDAPCLLRPIDYEI